jgi:hypothetical protein
MYLYPSEDTLFPPNRPIDVYVFGIAEDDSTSRFVNGYRGEGLDSIDVDCLEDALGPTEDDGGISGDVGLYSRLEMKLRRHRKRYSQQDAGHPNAQY